MPESPLIAAGAQVQPVSAAPLHVNRMFTGLWTHRNPLRDAATPYLMEKFYSATRFDSLIDGQNIEVSPTLELVRRVGFSAYNTRTRPSVQRFYEFRAIVANQHGTATITGITALHGLMVGSGKLNVYCSPILNLPVGTTVSFTGLTNYTILNGLTLATGMATTPASQWFYFAGWYGPSTGNWTGGIPAPDTGTASYISIGVPTLNNRLLVDTISDARDITDTSDLVLFTKTAGAGRTCFLAVGNICYMSDGIDQKQYIFPFKSWLPNTAYAVGENIIDSNGNLQSVKSISGTNQSGSTQPTWLGVGADTTDGGLVWHNFGKPVFQWGAAAPTVAPTLTPTTGNRQWTANTNLTLWYSILDENGNVEVNIGGSGGTMTTGATEPAWNAAGPGTPGISTGITIDGTVNWANCGPPSAWLPSTAYKGFQCIVDTNGNLQIVTGGTSGNSGSSAPTWATTIGATTSDGGLTWTNVGPGSVLATDVIQYAYSYHYVSGHVTTASPIATLNATGTLMGAPGGALCTVSGPNNTDPGMDQIWIWRTLQGGSTLLLDAQIPNPSIGSPATWTYTDTNPDSALNPYIQAPIAQSNNPPPANFTPECYHDGRIFGFVGALLYYSNGPDSLTGVGNESFPPNNKFLMPSQGVACWSTALGVIVFRIDGMSVVVGSGTGSDPFRLLNIFDSVGLANRDAWSTRGNTVYMMSRTGKVIRLTTAQIVAAVEGELTESLDDLEIGFPIGDRLEAYVPGSAYVEWHEGPSSDTRLFVADGSGSWYNMLHVTQPEACEPWSPIGTYPLTAIKSARTAPGVQSLLLATTNGWILKRDLTTNQDNGVPFAAFTVAGSIVLSQPGSQAGLQYITTEELPFAGATPVTVAVLLGEIQGNFVTLRNESPDPPNQPASQSVLARRSWASQGPDTVQTCRHMQVKFSWPAENFANALLTYTIYGRLPEKARK